MSRSAVIENVEPASAIALALGEADAVGAVLGDTDGDAVLTGPHEIAKTSVKSASNFIIGFFILCCLLA